MGQQMLHGDPAPEGLEVGTDLKQTWGETSGWMRYFSVVMYILLGLVIFYTFFLLYLLSKFPVSFPGHMKTLMFFSFFVTCVLCGYQGIYMGQFGKALRNAVRYDASDWLDYSAEKLHAYYRFVGLSFLISLIFTILAALYIYLMPPV